MNLCVGGAQRTNVTARWLPKGEFDHSAHQMLTCASCHAGVEKSADSADVPLPGIQIWQQRHGVAKQAANASCFECHQYHEWSKEKRSEGKYTIRQL